MWIGPVRPLLMFSYWINTQISLQDTSSYHLFNILIHALTGILVFLVIRRLMEWAGAGESSRTPLAVFGALLFLLHPLQTESVAYISGRSESLCGMFGCASLAAFLYRRSAAISWAGVAAVVLLFGAAVLTKEQAVVLPVVFVLTDIWWNPDSPLRSVRANWKLYVVLAAGAAARRGALLETDPRCRHRGQRRLRDEGLYVVSVPVHRVPRDLRVPLQLSAARTTQRGLGLSDLAQPLRPRRNLRSRRPAGAGGAGVALSPQFPPGGLWLLPVPGAACSHVEHPAD